MRLICDFNLLATSMSGAKSVIPIYLFFVLVLVFVPLFPHVGQLAFGTGIVACFLGVYIFIPSII